ncbi:MAG: hypothetical protein KGJ02_00115 [Verrucomicrobiota bacterium]|nr:hypothetical protein [Verrucomicrobiota bacterium]
MELERFSLSEGFFSCSEPLVNPEVTEFKSIKGRLSAFLNLLDKLALVPLAFFYKLYKSFFCCLRVGVGAIGLFLTFGMAPLIREFFVEHVSLLARDLADWVLWPMAVLTCLGRLLLATLVHPALYFGF